MPELPDVTVYTEALQARIAGETLERVRLASPLLRSVAPPITAASGRRVIGLRRLGKRIVIGLEGDFFLMLHMMIAGRLHWKAAGARLAGKIGLAAFDFPSGTLVLTEAGTKRRAALCLVRGGAGLAEHDPGGLEVLDSDAVTFRAALTRENHTLKRALTDPGILSGIGNAYSDEILHRAKMPPVKQTRQLSPEESARLLPATRDTLLRWCDRMDPGGRRVPGGCHGISRGDGRARALRQAVPGVRIGRAADRPTPTTAWSVRRRPVVGRPRAVTPAQAGLAANARGARRPDSGGAAWRERAQHLTKASDRPCR